MILSVVADRYDATPIACGIRWKHLEEVPETLAIESSAFPPVHEFAVVQAYGSEIAHTLSRRVMVQNRVLGFRWNPHPAPRSVLLKVHFVQSPDVNSWIFPQFAEFF